VDVAGIDHTIACVRQFFAQSDDTSATGGATGSLLNLGAVAMTSNQLLLFVIAGLLLNLTPGPDVLYIVTNALRWRRPRGMVAALGITAGCFVHIVAAAVGVSALMAASATAFTVLKWLGAAYLVYVGCACCCPRPGVLSIWKPHR
jgi:hypothetical protein